MLRNIIWRIKQNISLRPYVLNINSSPYVVEVCQVQKRSKVTYLYPVNKVSYVSSSYFYLFQHHISNLSQYNARTVHFRQYDNESLPLQIWKYCSQRYSHSNTGNIQHSVAKPTPSVKSILEAVTIPSPVLATTNIHVLVTFVQIVQYLLIGWLCHSWSCCCRCTHTLKCVD